MAPSADGEQIFTLFCFLATMNRQLTLVQPVKVFLSGTLILEKVKSGHRVSETCLTHKEGSGVKSQLGTAAKDEWWQCQGQQRLAAVVPAAVSSAEYSCDANLAMVPLA